MPRKTPLTTWSLTIHLIKQDRHADHQIMSDIDKWKNETILLEDGNDTVEAQLYFERQPSQKPKWARFFGDLLAEVDLPRVSSAPAVLVVPVDNRIFTLSFSRGSSLLQDEAIDPTFGLRTALNSVNPHRVRSYDKRSFDALFRQTREQASNETKLESFGIDAERDLVRSVSGKPTDSNLGSSMTGGSSLRVAAKVNPSTVTHYLRRLHRKFELDNFASEYPWLGQIEAVGDTEMQELLDSYLDDVLRGENATNRVFLSVPQIIDWSESSGFRFVLSSRSKHIFPEITLANLARATGENIFDVEFFKRQHVEMLDENDARLKLWSLYKCLNAEIEATRHTP